jgi:hypothetical protein
VSPLKGRRARVAIIVVVLGCLVAAALVDRNGSTDSDAAAEVVTLGPRVPPADAVETAWYCAEGTSNPGGRADETVLIANVDERDAHARISVMQGPEVAPKVMDLDVGGETLAAIRVGDILPIAEPGVLVEITGARAVVSHSVTGNGDAGVGPCARDAAPRWHFAAGTTAKGATLFLALFNPFADDAIVDVAFLTNAGPLAPGDLQGFVVPARTRITVAVHEQARRDDLVATEVIARRGRVVAEQSQNLDGSDGRKGLALSLGAPEPARRWEFASGSVVGGRTETMVLANPTTTPTNATIQTRLDGGVLEPETVSLPGRTAVAVDLGRRVPAGVGFSVQVRSPIPIVAESLLAVRAPFATSQRGIATAIGSVRAASRWIDSPARANPSSLDRVAVLNPGLSPVTFHLTERHGGRISTPLRMARVRVAPGKRVVVDLNALNIRPDAFVVIDATGPIVVDRESAGMPGVTAAAVIPDFGR